MIEKWITVKDYADRNNITEKTVYNRIKSESIPKHRVKKVLNTILIKV